MSTDVPIDETDRSNIEYQHSGAANPVRGLNQDQLLFYCQSIIANAPNGSVAVLDRELRCQLIEGQILAELGLKKEDLIGKLAEELLPADEVEHHLAHYQRALSGDTSFKEFKYQDRIFSSHAVPLHIGGKIEGIILFTRDITLQKQEEYAHVSRARQQAVVAELGQRALSGQSLGELMHEAVTVVANTLDVEYCKVLELLPDGKALLLRAGVGWSKDYPLNIATVSAGLESQAGYTLKSNGPVIVKDLRTETRFNGPPLLHEHQIISGISVVIKGREQPYGVMGAHTTRQRLFTRNQIDFLQSVANTLAMAIERQHVDDALRQVNETLEEKVRARTQELGEANQELKRARDLFYTLFHASPFPTSITRLSDSSFLEVNEAFLRYFGWEREQVVGKTTFELNLWSNQAQREQLLVELRDHGRLRNTERQFRLPTGEIRNILVSFEMTDFNGEPCLIGSLIDITERAEAEHRVRQLASDLALAEQRERRRVAQILHDEFQQLLVALQLNLQMLARKTDLETSEQLNNVADQVDDVIEMSRNLAVEFSAPVLKSEDLSKGFSWLAELMYERYELQVALEIESTLKIAHQDFRELLFQTVRELLFNVVKHAGVKQARLRASLEDGNFVICVEDSGSGFDVTNIMSKEISGVSFGLSSIRERLELFDGRLELESSIGVGTHATIVIPAEIENL